MNIIEIYSNYYYMLAILLCWVQRNIPNTYLIVNQISKKSKTKYGSMARAAAVFMFNIKKNNSKM